MLDALARLAAHRPWRVVVAAILFAALAGVLGGPVAALLKTGGFADPASQSQQGMDRIRQATGISPEQGFVVLVDGGTTDRATLRSLSRALQEAAGRVGFVKGYTDYFSSGGNGAFLSADGRSFYALIDTGDIAATLGGKEASAQLGAAIGAEPALRGHVTVGGATQAQMQVSDQVSSDLARAEALAFPILFVVLFFVFRAGSPIREWRRTRSLRAALRLVGHGVTAALLPIIAGVVTILAGFLGLRAVNQVTDLSIFALNLCTGLGLGLSIDYSLLLLSRYREEVARHGAGLVAMRRTLATAGRTVLFSSLTVAAAAAALIVFPLRFLYSMGVGGVIVTLSAATISLTLLPALLVLLGARVAPASGASPAVSERGFWHRLSHVVMHRPAMVAAATGAVMILLGLPFLGIRFTSVDASVLPTTASARQVDDALKHDFPGDRTRPLTVVVDAPADAGPQVQAYAQQVGGAAGVAAVVPPRRLDASTWRVDAYSGVDPLSQQAQDMVDQVRAVPAPGARYVLGEAAGFRDLQASLAAHLPLALGIVVVATLSVLFAMTGSVILPIKALIMNVLTLSAAFGVLVLIFQDGRFEGLLGYTSQGALESTQPILLFAIAFGLSTDYGVFLLGRIKEGHDAGMPTREAVASGLQRTGRIISAAALLFVIAIGSFATSQIIFIKEVGLGTAAAVVIDATIVRALLVPSLMALLGTWNWWAPRPLRALHRRLRLDRLEPGASAA